MKSILHGPRSNQIERGGKIMKGKAPKPSLLQRAAAATHRTILNLGDEAYGQKVDWQENARRSRDDLYGAVRDEAESVEYLEEVMQEHVDLLTDEDEYGTEFKDTIDRRFIRKFSRELTRHEEGRIEEFIADYRRDQDGER